MPSKGFKSITVTDAIYNTFFHTWEKNKDALSMKGINSFSGYITFMITELMYADKTFKKYKPIMQKLVIEYGRVLIKDNIMGRVAEIVRVKKMWRCMLCDRDDCLHIGFCYSLHEFYEL